MKRITLLTLFSLVFTLTSLAATNTILESKSISCHGMADGELTFSASDPAAAASYKYMWYHGAGTDSLLTNYSDSKSCPVAKMLSAGTYHLIVTLADSTILDSTYTLKQPDAISIDPVSVTHCSHWGANLTDCNGAISFTVSGGISPYSYTVYDSIYQITYANKSNLTNLASGNYDISVTDASGCTYDTVIEIKNNASGGLGLPQGIQYICYRSSGGNSISLQLDDIYPETVMWEEDVENQETALAYVLTKEASEATSGYDGNDVIRTYQTKWKTISVYDSITDTKHDSVIYWVDTFLRYMAVIDKNDGSGSQIVLSATKNLYSKNPPSAIFLTSGLALDSLIAEDAARFGKDVWERIPSTKGSTGSKTAMEPGLHKVRYWDSNGNGGRSSWTIIAAESPVTLNVTETKTNKCFHDTIAAITATAQGSWQEYPSAKHDIALSLSAVAGTGASMAKVISPGSSNGNGLNTNSWSNLPAGIYTVNASISSPTGTAGSCTCSRQQSIEITQPDSLYIVFTNSKKASCPNKSDAFVTADVVNAQGNVTYSWSNGSTTNSAVDIMMGKYTLTATDQNGCTATDSISLGVSRKNCIYNIVTPNGDGCNDLFDLTDFCMGFKMKCNIFDNNGRKVATLDENNSTWDPREDTYAPPTGQTSNYTAFIRLINTDGKRIADLAETFSVIYADYPNLSTTPCSESESQWF